MATPSMEVVVEEDSDVVDPGRTSAAVTVIEVDERLPATADVASAVDSASGVVVRRLGGLGDYSEVSIRGSSARHVQVFLDGVPLNPSGSSAINLSELPLSAFERVEVYRGNAPPSFGAAPVGGVVNLVSGDTPGVGGSVSYGAFTTARATGHVFQPLEVFGESADVLAFAELFGTRGDYRYFSDNGTPYELFDDARPTRGNNHKSQLSTHVRVGLGERHRVSVSNAFLSRDEGIPGHLNSPTTAAGLQTWRNLATLRAEQRPGLWSLSQRLWLHHRHETLDDQLGEVGIDNQWERNEVTTVGLLAHAGWAGSAVATPSLTASVRRDRFEKVDLEEARTSSPAVRHVGLVSASAHLRPFGDVLRLTPVAQLDVLDNRLLGKVPFSETAIAPEGEEQQVVGSPRLGVLVRPTEGLALKGNLGRFFRAPDFAELFGDRGGIVGNTALVPEIGWQGDVGVRGEASMDDTHAVAELTGFASHVDNQIVLVQNGQGTSVPRNIGRATTLGLEAATTVRTPWLDVQLNGTWTRARNRTDTDELLGKQLPRVPALELNEQVSVHAYGVRVGHSFSYTTGNYWDATNWFLAPPRAIHGAFARAEVRSISLELSVLNLFDRQVALVDRNPLDEADDTTVVQPINDFFGYPLPGRAWMLTLRWTGPEPHKETGP